MIVEQRRSACSCDFRLSLHLAVQVLGFVGAPFTLASYIIEGGSSKNFAHVKQMAFSNPEVLHALNSKLADSVADYVRYQVSAQLQHRSRRKRQNHVQRDRVRQRQHLM